GAPGLVPGKLSLELLERQDREPAVSRTRYKIAHQRRAESRSDRKTWPSPPPLIIRSSYPLCSSPIGALWLPNARANELVLTPLRSYFRYEKTAVSIPEDIFEGADQLARKTKRSRSRLFSD